MNEGFEIELLEKIAGSLHRLERGQHETQCLLQEVLARLPLETYHPTVGGSITVAE